MTRRAYRVLGARVHAVTAAELLDQLCAPRQGRPLVVAHHNLHSAALQRRVPGMRRLYERADVVYVDGMPLVWFGRLLRLPLRRPHRMTCVDWLEPFLARAAADGVRVFVVGGRPDAHATAMAEVRRRHETLQIEGHHGYFDVAGAENAVVLRAIADARPDVVLVGMGMPRQELWLDEHLDAIGAGAVVTVGACFDYVAGTMYTPPRWLSRIGFEWAGRLAAEPARLGYRYLVEPWTLVPVALGELWRRWARRSDPHAAAE
jgi:N-acetylglucosaminyldiphosphoundecaprenol N-acetyl-beta-D-mannosaminyltransferase